MDLARIESQLAAMQADVDHESRPEPAPEPEREPALTVEAVRAHRPTLGVRPDPDRTPAPAAPVPAEMRGRDALRRGM